MRKSLRLAGLTDTKPYAPPPQLINGCVQSIYLGFRWIVSEGSRCGVFLLGLSQKHILLSDSVRCEEGESQHYSAENKAEKTHSCQKKDKSPVTGNNREKKGKEQREKLEKAKAILFSSTNSVFIHENFFKTPRSFQHSKRG